MSATGIVIFNVFGHLNSGDAVLVETLADLLHEHHPESQITGIAFDPNTQSQWMPEIAWSERIANTPQNGLCGRAYQVILLVAAILISLHQRFGFLTRLFPQPQRLAFEALVNADLALSCPGGYLEDSNHGYIINCISMLVACRLSKCVVLAPQTVGPIRSKLGRFIIRRVTERADRIFLRERESLKFLNEVLGEDSTLISRKVEVAGDLAFWFTRDSKEDIGTAQRNVGIRQNEKIVGMTVVDWAFPHAANYQEAKQNYIQSLSALIKHITASGLYQIVIFNQVSSDLSLAKYLGELHPEVVVDTLERDSACYSKLIATCDVFVGTRFHSCILALLEGIPTVAIAYLPKTNGVMNDLGLSDHVIDINNVTGQQLIDHFEQMRAHRDRISQTIRNAVQTYRANHGGFIRFLTDESQISAA